jgi:hypothetical protein
MADPVWVDGTTPLNSVNMTKLQTRDEKNAPSGYVGLSAASQIVFQGDAAANLYRSSAGVVGTDGSITSKGFFSSIPAAATAAFAARLQGDANNRYYVDTNGFIQWGPGNTGADTYLSRSAVSTLNTNSNFQAAIDVFARYGSAQQVGIGSVSSGLAGVNFGTDSLVYRAGARVLQSNSALVLQPAPGATAPALATLADADTSWRLYIQADGTLRWGDGTNPADVSLYRVSAGYIATDGGMNFGKRVYISPPSPTDLSLLTIMGGDVDYRFQMNANGQMNWGAGTSGNDTSLSRTGAGILTANAHLQALSNVFVGNALYVGAANDAYLSRPAAATIAASGAFQTGGNLTLRPGSAMQMLLGGLFGDTAPGVQFGSAGDTNLYRTAVNTLGLLGVGAAGWGTFQAGAFSVQSDRSTKTDVEPVEADWHDRLLSAGIYTYRRDNTDERHLGVMADELPGSVLVPGRDDLQFVDLYKLTVALLGTVQHLAGRLDTVEGGLNARYQ